MCRVGITSSAFDGKYILRFLIESHVKTAQTFNIETFKTILIFFSFHFLSSIIMPQHGSSVGLVAFAERGRRDITPISALTDKKKRKKNARL